MPEQEDLVATKKKGFCANLICQNCFEEILSPPVLFD